MKELKISKIKDGTVIDHIPAGRAYEVVSILGLWRSNNLVLIAMNVDSRKMGRKDIVKVEGRFLSDRETEAIALIAPTATINIIKNYKVVKKSKVRLPSVVKGLLTCPNPTCISRVERQVESRFEVVRKKPLILKCVYCEERIKEDEVYKYLRLK